MNKTPLDPDGEIDRIIDELCEYEFFNPHHEPRTMVELKQIAKSRLLEMLQEAREAGEKAGRIDELEMVVGLSKTWKAYSKEAIRTLYLERLHYLKEKS